MSKLSKTESRYMARVAYLPCCACNNIPVQVHHLRGIKRNNFLVIPLCPACHTGEFSIHMDRKSFEAIHGSELFLLAKTIEALNK